MNREKRQFVHELAQHFGCATEAYDSEPKRNVVATAGTDKSFLQLKFKYLGVRLVAIFLQLC